MTGARAIWLVSLLALVAIAGIVGMLLAGGGWDWLFFAMAALPPAVGGWCWWRLRGGAGR
ncbi:MAG: hypothetical protein QM761_06405 [Pseudoxanthomonas sp.]